MLLLKTSQKDDRFDVAIRDPALSSLTHLNSANIISNSDLSKPFFVSVNTHLLSHFGRKFWNKNLTYGFGLEMVWNYKEINSNFSRRSVYLFELLHMEKHTVLEEESLVRIQILPFAVASFNFWQSGIYQHWIENYSSYLSQLCMQIPDYCHLYGSLPAWKKCKKDIASRKFVKNTR